MRRAIARVHLGEHLRQHPVARHDHEDAWLRDDHHQDHGRQADHRADLHDQAQPAQLRDGGHGGDHGFGGIQHRVRHQAGQYRGHGQVQHGADHQRHQDAERQVALRRLAFLRRRGGRLEADVGEEDHGRAAHDAGPAVFAVALRFRNERVPVFRVHVAVAGDHHDDDQAHLDQHHQRVQRGGLADADVTQPGECQHDRHGRQVEQVTGGHEFAVGEGQRRLGERDGEVQAHVIEQAGEIPGPAGRHCRGRNAVLGHHVPADEPGCQFAQ